jgi:diaminohydroxyphosphoribosylaminopyrimidine deaminase/5-amino-6-(5-phosphoribosylamino)uracil reductase
MSLARRDRHFLLHALKLARLGHGLTLPNPLVGAVLVRKGRVIGQGYHQRAGQPHAEVNAIADAHRRGHSPAGATIYVTLEPCSTHGRTPPCTDLILREKVARVVFAATDPNPAHAGCAVSLLRKHGVEVSHGLLAREAAALNRGFNFYITHGRPWVVAKIALSLDGKITTPATDDRWLTSPAARHQAHLLRWASDAILIGAQTARDDNPQLTIRLPRRPHAGAPKVEKQQPWRVVLTRSGNLPPHLHLFSDEHRDRTLVYQSQPLREVLAQLGARKISHLLLEGGAQILTEAFAEGLVNEVAFFVAPAYMGTLSRALAALPKPVKLKAVRVCPCGPDLYLRGLC